MPTLRLSGARPRTAFSTTCFTTSGATPSSFHHRSFKPRLELAELETYAAQLESAAEHGNDGTLGCFVRTEARDDGTVRVKLYERWFDGQHLRCEQLADREFDSTAEDALVASSEFLAELQAWAEQRNQEQDLDAVARQSVEAAHERARTQRSTERAAAADELAQILAGVNKHA